MPRKSNLTDRQWDKLHKRLLAGEKAAQLAREFGVSKSAISARFSKRMENVKATASLIAAADEALEKLNLQEQVNAFSLADELRSISKHLAGAGRNGAMTAHRLAGLARFQAEKVDEIDPSKSSEALQNIAILTKLSNESAQTGLGLLAANKEFVKEQNAPKQMDKSEFLRELAECLPD